MGNITIEEEGKAEVPNAFFTSGFSSETCYPQGTQPPELEDGAGEQNKRPSIPSAFFTSVCSDCCTGAGRAVTMSNPRRTGQYIYVWTLQKLLCALFPCCVFLPPVIDREREPAPPPLLPTRIMKHCHTAVVTISAFL